MSKDVDKTTIASLRREVIAAGLGGDEEQKTNFVIDVMAALRRRRSFSDAVTSALSTRTMHLSLCDTKEEAMAKVFQVGDTADEREMRRRELAGLPVLRDGERLHVGVRFMDAMENNNRAAIERAKAANHRPGFRQDAAVADARQRVRDEYQNYENYINSAWRGNLVPDQPEAALQDSMKMDEIYRAYDAEISQRWRMP